MRRIALGVALLGAAMVGVWMIGVPDREHAGSASPPEDTGGTASAEDSASRPPRLAEDDAPSPDANGGTPPPESGDTAPSQGESGAPTLAEEPGTDPAESTYPRIKSLVRLDPSDRRTNADFVAWRITFSEPVTNVDDRDFVIIGTPWRLTVTKVGESGDAYDIALDSNGLADHNGLATLAFSRGIYIKNLDGNRLLNVNADGPYEASFVIDNAAPTVALKPDTGKIDDAGGSLTLTFSESVYSDPIRTAFTEAMLAGLIDLREDDESGARIPFTASIDQDNATVTIDPTGLLPAQTWVRVNDGYYDTVGNEGAAATAAFTLDTIRPTVTIDGVPATDSGAFMATFTFSEAVTGFTASEVAVTNGTASALIEVQGGRQWHVRITPTGDYSVTLPADRVTDLAGNGNAASTSREGSYGDDVTDPRLLSIIRQHAVELACARRLDHVARHLQRGRGAVQCRLRRPVGPSISSPHCRYRRKRHCGGRLRIRVRRDLLRERAGEPQRHGEAWLPDERQPPTTGFRSTSGTRPTVPFRVARRLAPTSALSTWTTWRRESPTSSGRAPAGSTPMTTRSPGR